MRIRKRQNGKWQVEIRICHQNISKTFADKKSCIQFGKTVENQLRTFNTTKDMSTTVEQVIHKYIDDFSIHRKQSANEINKLKSWFNALEPSFNLFSLNLRKCSPVISAKLNRTSHG